MLSKTFDVKPNEMGNEGCGEESERRLNLIDFSNSERESVWGVEEDTVDESLRDHPAWGVGHEERWGARGRERGGREPMEASSLLPKPPTAVARLAFEGIDAGITFVVAPFSPFLPERGQRVDGPWTIQNFGDEGRERKPFSPVLLERGQRVDGPRTILNFGDEGRERKAAGLAVGVRFVHGCNYGARSESKGGNLFADVDATQYGLESEGPENKM
jgi:hypothetical protein